MFVTELLYFSVLSSIQCFPAEGQNIHQPSSRMTSDLLKMESRSDLSGTQVKDQVLLYMRDEDLQPYITQIRFNDFSLCA